MNDEPLSINQAINTISSGSFGDDGSVSISKENIDKLLQQGLIEPDKDGNFRLTVSQKEVDQALGGQSSPVKLNRNITITTKDSVESAQTTELSPTQGMSTPGANAIRALNQDPAEPAGNASSNPYLGGGLAAKTRIALTSLFAIQMEVASKMQENNKEMMGLIAKSSMGQAAGIKAAAEGEQFGMAMSCVASATAATSLLTGSVLQSRAKLQEISHRHTAKMLRANPGKSTKAAQVVTDSPQSEGTTVSKKKTIKDGILSVDVQAADRFDSPFEGESSGSIARPSGRISIDLQEAGSTKAAGAGGKAGPDIEGLKKAQIKEDLDRAIMHETMADIYANKSNLAFSMAKVQENMSMAMKYSAQIMASKMSTEGKVQEILNSTAEKMAEKGQQSASGDLRQALDNASKILQAITSQAQAESEVQGKIIRG